MLSRTASVFTRQARVVAARASPRRIITRDKTTVDIELPRPLREDTPTAPPGYMYYPIEDEDILTPIPAVFYMPTEEEIRDAEKQARAEFMKQEIDDPLQLPLEDSKRKELIKLSEENGWVLGAQNGRDVIRKKYMFRDFYEAWMFMKETAKVASDMDHYPGWFNVYNEVDVALSTHTEGGLSRFDFILAGKMDALYGKYKNLSE